MSVFDLELVNWVVNTMKKLFTLANVDSDLIGVSIFQEQYFLNSKKYPKNLQTYDPHKLCKSFDDCFWKNKVLENNLWPDYNCLSLSWVETQHIFLTFSWDENPCE